MLSYTPLLLRTSRWHLGVPHENRIEIGRNQVKKWYRINAPLNSSKLHSNVSSPNKMKVLNTQKKLKKCTPCFSSSRLRMFLSRMWTKIKSNQSLGRYPSSLLSLPLPFFFSQIQNSYSYHCQVIWGIFRVSFLLLPPLKSTKIRAECSHVFHGSEKSFQSSFLFSHVRHLTRVRFDTCEIWHMSINNHCDNLQMILKFMK